MYKATLLERIEISLDSAKNKIKEKYKAYQETRVHQAMAKNPWVSLIPASIIPIISLSVILSSKDSKLEYSPIVLWFLWTALPFYYLYQNDKYKASLLPNPDESSEQTALAGPEKSKRNELVVEISVATPGHKKKPK